MTDPTRPVVCFAGVDWWYHSRAHSDVQLCLQIARERPVLLVNSIGMRVPVPGRGSNFARKIVRKARSVARFLQKPVPDCPNFNVLSPLSVPLYGSQRGRIVATRVVEAQVRFAMSLLGMERPHVVVTVPTAWPVVERLPHGRVVYNRSDVHSEFSEADQDYIRSLERQLFEHCDGIVYVNRRLMEEERTWTGDRAHFLDHGLDVELFDPRTPREEPADLAPIPHPRVGFIGNLRPHLVDFELLRRIARERPRLQLVLAGDIQGDPDAFQDLANVHRLGHRPYSQVPALLQHLDVGLLPYRVNDWILRCNPIKLKEYLALGLRTVSTRYPAVEAHAPPMRIADDPVDFVRAIDAALEDDPPAPLDLSRASWRAKAEELLGILDGDATRPRSLR